MPAEITKDNILARLDLVSLTRASMVSMEWCWFALELLFPRSALKVIFDEYLEDDHDTSTLIKKKIQRDIRRMGEHASLPAPNLADYISEALFSPDPIKSDIIYWHPDMSEPLALLLNHKAMDADPKFYPADYKLIIRHLRNVNESTLLRYMLCAKSFDIEAVRMLTVRSDMEDSPVGILAKTLSFDGIDLTAKPSLALLTLSIYVANGENYSKALELAKIYPNYLVIRVLVQKVSLATNLNEDFLLELLKLTGPPSAGFTNHMVLICALKGYSPRVYQALWPNSDSFESTLVCEEDDNVLEDMMRAPDFFQTSYLVALAWLKQRSSAVTARLLKTQIGEPGLNIPSALSMTAQVIPGLCIDLSIDLPSLPLDLLLSIENLSSPGGKFLQPNRIFIAPSPLPDELLAGLVTNSGATSPSGLGHLLKCNIGPKATLALVKALGELGVSVETALEGHPVPELRLADLLSLEASLTLTF